MKNAKLLKFLSPWVAIVLATTSFYVNADQPVKKAVGVRNELPLNAFHQNPSIERVRLSPNGKNLLALTHVEETTLIMVINLETQKVFYPAKTNNEEFSFWWVNWANDERILVSMRYDSGHGRKRRHSQTRLVTMDAFKPSAPVNMVKPYSDKDDNMNISREAVTSARQDNVISYLHDDPDHILLSVNREHPYRPTVYKVNVNTGVMSRVKKHSMHAYGWYADRQGKVRAAWDYDDKTLITAYRVLDPKTNKWTKAWEYKNLSEPEISIAGFGYDPSDLYIFADHNGKRALFKVDLSKEGYPKELIIADEDRDISGRLIYSVAKRKVVGVYYTDEKSDSLYWDKGYQAFQASLDKIFPNNVNFIADMSDDGRRYVVYNTGMQNPGAYYFGDRDKKTLAPVGQSYPMLTQDILVTKKPLKYEARDGLEIEGFLSLPKDFKGKPQATIILPHGGPMYEDAAEFDMFSSFFANRGYVVFQPNFRGSTGYGHHYTMQAVADFGGAMQDDLEDAVQFLVKEKYTDIKKVCIVGASYGGYAAMMGLVKTPDLYKCAISLAGISDLIKMRDEYRSQLRQTFFGDDDKALAKNSPARQVKKIKAPLLLMHGEDDTIVTVSQSQTMASKLKRHKKPFKYVELPAGNHWLIYYPNRVTVFEEMDAFIKRNLPLNKL